MAVALLPGVAVVIGLAGLLHIVLGQLGIVLPGVAEVLEAGVVLALLRAVTVVNAGGEGNLLGLDLTQTLDLTVGEGDEPGKDC